MSGRVLPFTPNVARRRPDPNSPELLLKQMQRLFPQLSWRLHQALVAFALDAIRDREKGGGDDRAS